MKILLPFLLAAAVSCGSATKAEPRKDIPTAPDETADRWEDLDRLDGSRVTLRGVLADQIDGSHAVFRMESGLKIYIPHFDKIALGHSWYDYLGNSEKSNTHHGDDRCEHGNFRWRSWQS